MKTVQHFASNPTAPSHPLGVTKAAGALVFFALPLVAWSQAGAEPGAKPTLSIVPRLAVSERYSDNIGLQSVGKRSELVTQISPGINITSQAGRIRGSLDYSLNELFYARNTSGRQTQNALSALATIEAIDNWAFLDINGNISQQAISAFGTQSSTDFAINGNSTETSVFRVSPYFKGRLSGSVDYEARYSWSNTNADSAAASDVRSRNALLRLNGALGGPLSWVVDANSEDVDYSLGRAIAADRIKATFTYTFNPQVNASLITSRDSDNYTSLSKQTRTSAGLGVNWRISERTNLAAQIERRSFGQSHNLSFVHRTARTSWRFSDTRDVANSAVQTGSTVVGTLAGLLDSQFSSVETDPIRRGELVGAFLQNNGLNPNASVISNFLSSSVSLQRRQEIAFALLGVRDTISFSLTRGSNSQLDTLVRAADDFSTASVIRQTGASITYAHRLTPDAAVNVVASRQNTSGSLASQSTSLRSVDLILSGRLGRQMTGSVGARRTVFDNTAAPYTETAVTGNLNLQF